MDVDYYIDKVENFSKLPQKQRVKLLSYFHLICTQTETFSVQNIREVFEKHKLESPSNINREITALSSSKPKILIKNGLQYAFERSAKKELDEIYLSNSHSQIISTKLRELLIKINSAEQKSFLEEAISCFEIKSFRAAVVMAWLLAIDTIYEFILREKIIEFNSAVQLQGKYKKLIISSKDHFSEIKESDFIEILRTGKLISNDIRKILVEKLEFRNTCAHPNQIVIKETKVIAYIEDLIENIILKFKA
jgi:hypothetical protein